MSYIVKIQQRVWRRLICFTPTYFPPAVFILKQKEGTRPHHCVYTFSGSVTPVSPGLLLIFPVLMAPTPASMCTPLKTLSDNLSHRRRYMKHNFPINYTIRVHQKEIFKLSNIRRMVQAMTTYCFSAQFDLLTVSVPFGGKIIRIMPERHPSRSYTAELERRFKDAEGVFVQSQPPEVKEPDLVPESSWRFAFPKSLLDNLFHTMYCLFSECFSSEDFCFWRKFIQRKSVF
uniref:Interleukin 34 n=1 Tax=Salarias fasciatus TaxID=181472 RepID=A0A672HZF1_SALFA